LREIPLALAPTLRAHTLLLARRQRLNTHPSGISRNLPPCFSGTKTLLEYKHFKKKNAISKPASDASTSTKMIMNHNHKDYNNDYTHGGGASTKKKGTSRDLRTGTQ
jgi:hypothetical protein